jgi:transcription elongation factor GreA
MAEERFVLTRAGYEELQRELEALEAELDEEQAELRDFQSPIDSSDEEAAEFETRTTKEHDEERVGHLRLILEHAEVIDEDPDPHRIDPGDRVTVRDLDAHQIRQFDLLGSGEVRFGIEGVSIDSPVGQALLGRQVGDVITVDVPEGRVRYAVHKVERIPEERT